MTLKDAENIIAIPGHSGPHSEDYHTEIYRRLTGATSDVRPELYRKALIEELNAIAVDIVTEGTKLYKLLRNID